MIVPITTDEVWLRRFAGAAPLNIPSGPVVVVAPHPDDETLGAGALLATLRQRGIAVSVIAATDGENAYDISAEERLALGKMREREQEQALAELGVDLSSIHRLRLTDSGLLQLQKQLTESLLSVIEPGATLLAPWAGDFHPDHVACARAAEDVSAAKNVPLLSYFFWTWHRGIPDLLEGLPIRTLIPNQNACAAKQRALTMHHSQLEREDGEPILPDRLLGPARWPFEVFVQS